MSPPPSAAAYSQPIALAPSREAQSTRARKVALVLAVGGLALALGVAAAIRPALAVALLIGIGYVWGCTRSMSFAVAGLTAATFTESLDAITGTGASPLKLAGAIAIVLAAVLIVTRRLARPEWTYHPLVIAALLTYLGIGAASVGWAVDIHQVTTLTIRLVTDACTLLAAASLIRSGRQLVRIEAVVAASGALSVLYGVATGANLVGRAIGTFTDPNEFAAALVPAIACGYAIIRHSSSRLARWLSIGAMTSCVYGVLASQSRGGLISLLAMVAVLLVTARGKERTRLLGCVLIGLAAAGFVLVATPMGQDLLQRVTQDGSSGRGDLWRIALMEWRDHPVGGVGLGNFTLLSPDYLTSAIQHTELVLGAPRTVHNVPLEMLSELGIVGFVGFYGFVLGICWLLHRGIGVARRLEDGARLVALGRGLLAGLVGMIVSGLFLSAEYQSLLWLALGLGLAHHGVVRRVERRQRALAVPVVTLDISQADASATFAEADVG